jgi:hypothetical protein
MGLSNVKTFDLTTMIEKLRLCCMKCLTFDTHFVPQTTKKKSWKKNVRDNTKEVF